MEERRSLEAEIRMAQANRKAVTSLTAASSYSLGIGQSVVAHLLRRYFRLFVCFLSGIAFALPTSRSSRKDGAEYHAHGYPQAHVVGSRADGDA
jgi:hypothetical protein